jgi:hypothetical protein
VELRLIINKKPSKQKCERDLYWYDPHSKQMLHGKGKSIKFVYDRQSKRTIPHIVPGEENALSNNYSDIIEWIKLHNLSVLHDDKKYNIIVDIPAAQLDNILEDLYRCSIQCDYDPREHKLETSRRRR